MWLRIKVFQVCNGRSGRGIEQFAMHLGSAPQRVLKTHSSDEVAHLFPDPRPASPVATSSTPDMRRAVAASMRLIWACATGERSTILMTPHRLTDTEFHAASP